MGERDLKSRRARWTVVSAASIFAIVAAVASSATPALADSTHKYLFSVDTPSGTKPMPTAVDSNGDLYVYNDGTNTVSKYHPDLATHTLDPVNFSALGTNTIDGHGFGEDCPATPDDCDRVPSNGFGGSTNSGQGGNNLRGEVAVDNSTGPAHGYIYVVNPAGGPPGPISGQPLGSIEVFDSTGTYKGEIDKSVDGPTRSGPGGGFVNVDSAGDVFVDWPNLPPVIDEFVPVDGNPAHDNFRGQIYVGTPYEPSEAVGDAPYSYVDPEGPRWYKVSYSEYTARHNAYTNPDKFLFPSGESIFENGGYDAEVNSYEQTISIDPSTHDVYTSPGSVGYGRIREWSSENAPIGPVFGLPYTGEVWRLAVDGSTGPNAGAVYTQGSGNERDQIAVFSPPMPLPDIVYGTPTIGHSTAQLVAEVKLNGGPEVTSCELQWGTTTGYGNTPAYERKPVPCSPAPPYNSDQAVSANLASLPVEQDFHYRFVVKTANGEERGTNSTFRTAAVLGVTTESATNVTKTSATLNGSLNPDSLETTYHFEYGATTAYGINAAQRAAAEGSTVEALPGEDLTGLQPGRLYHYRLVATNTLGTTYGPDRTLQMPDRPSVFAMRTSNLSESSVDLQAKVNPLGFDTNYRFEYGLSATYGSATSETDLGAGTEPEDVETHVVGLLPGATYHFRVVATNQWGTTTGPDTTFSFSPPTCSNAHIRQETGANYLPDCRAYELVSPEDTNGTQILPGDSSIYWFNATGGGLGCGCSSELYFHQYSQNYAGLASGPSRFGYYASGRGMNGAIAPNTVGDLYISTRTDQGWVSRYVGVRGDQYLGGSNPQCSFQLDQCLEYPILGGTENGRQDNLPVVTDSTTGKSAGRLPSNYATAPDQREFLGTGRASGDFSHYAFASLERLFAVGGITAEPGSVYDNNLKTDTVEVVSKLQDGSPIPGEPDANGEGTEPQQGGSGFIGKDYFEVPAVSTDGSHILIGARVGPRYNSSDHPQEETRDLHLYMRVNDAVTYDVSKGHAVFLLGMTGDGSTVYFTSQEQLIPADTDTSVDLYRWSEATNELTLVSQGDGHGNTDECSASWTSKCDVQPLSTCTSAWTYECNYNHYAYGPFPFKSIRPDIDTDIARTNGAILFESPEQLDPNNPGVPGQRNLYEFRNGHVQYVTTFDPGGDTSRFNISPDGNHVAFLTDSRLTAYDNTSSGEVKCGAVFNLTKGSLDTPCREMYSYDAQTEELRCVSCNPSGAPPAGDVTASVSGPFMSDDGRVFFNTPDALVPGDTNGLVDVYEFVNGRPQLISTGTSNQDTFGGYIDVIVLGFVFAPEHVGLESVSADGQDVYFSTFDTLAPQDRNGEFVKMYDARTNGGIPSTPPALPCPAADECHGEGSSAPAEPQIGTGAPLNAGDGSTVGGKPKSGKQRRHKRQHHKHNRIRPVRHRLDEGPRNSGGQR